MMKLGWWKTRDGFTIVDMADGWREVARLSPATHLLWHDPAYSHVKLSDLVEVVQNMQSLTTR